MIRATRSLYRIRIAESFGVLADASHKQKLLRDYLEMKVLSPLLPFKDQRNATILNYRVSSYDLSSLDFLFYEIFLRQVYFFDADSTRPFVIDCGSHIGLSVLYIKTLFPDAQVIAFEPAPDNFRFLSENIKQNALEDVTLVNKALANEEGTMKFYGDDSMIANLFASTRSGQSTTDVEVVKLSTYIDRPVDFLKMDIEGAEGMVLEDLATADKLRMVKQMIIEYHHHLDKYVDSLSKFLKTLEDNNFGYLIDIASDPPYRKMTYEDVMIYAYQK